MKPEDFTKTGSESGEQRAVFAWAALNVGKFPELRWMFHVPNGGMRGNDAKTRAIMGNAMKAEGVKSGVADIFLPYPKGTCNGLWIEMKKKGKKVIKGSDQDLFGKQMLENGFGWCECDSYEKARDILIQYLSQ